MRAHEYIQRVTAGISDPDRAADVRKELQAHVDQSVAELIGKPVDEEEAELIAVGRMGSPEPLTRQFAEVHHPHLPWRHYLSVIPLACLTVMFFTWDAPSDDWVPWWAMLAVCLFPDRAALDRLFALVKTDVAAKHNWLARQPLRSATLVGGVAGVLAGAGWAVIPVLWESMWEQWGDLLRVSGVTHHPNPVLHVGLPLMVAAMAALLLRRFYSGPWPVLAVFSGLAFPIGFLPVYFLWGRYVTDWVTMALFLQIVYLVSALVLAWFVEKVRPREQPSSVL